ncbi:glycosyltransferase family protein [Lacinutrix venerupis]|uniref:Uncharacterized protein n=1 Tax=Lacinutrix venerupis TaxID=1486034 RepID=A0AAC9PVM7_9FLAO|nr:glycosyltransferase family 1 protein [Lacinutrix venerupis]APX98897.1 hypothetical protein BWR22_00775 [Lacinutrix venerupis]
MKTILVNASAANTGGAETILRTFVSEIKKETQYKFVILSPHKFNLAEKHITFEYAKTSGFKTVWFTIKGIGKYVKKYSPNKIISFNNLNYIFKPGIGITYFHQPKALEKGYSDVKIKVYQFIISKFLKKNTFIVQSEYIRNKFLKMFNYEEDEVISCWPGFIIPKQDTSLNSKISSNFKHKGLLPIAYASPHKNVKSLEEIYGFLEENNIEITTLLNPANNYLSASKNINSIGAITRQQLFGLYKDIDFLIFTSKDETVGLPIFEFLQTGKPAFVYAADYAIEFNKQFGNPENLVLFKDAEEFKTLFLQKINCTSKPFDYSKGEWYKIIDLI